MPINTRKKGQRSFAKAMRYAKFKFPHAAYIPIYQVSRFSQPQPFDLLLLDFDAPAMLIEVRTNQWGVSKPQTVRLANLPGVVIKEIWMFKRGCAEPLIRRYSQDGWGRIACGSGS